MFFRRYLYRSFLRMSGVKHWIARHLTPAGVLFASALTVGLVFGFETEQKTIYQAFAILLALFLVTFPFMLRFKVGFLVERSLPPLATVGKSVRYVVHLRHFHRRVQAGLTFFDNLADPRPTEEQFIQRQIAEERQIRSFSIGRRPPSLGYTRAVIKPRATPTLLTGKSANLEMELLPLRRGKIEFKGASLSRTDPLGLFRSFSTVAAPDHLLVLPRRYRVPQLDLRGAAAHQPGGVALASRIGEAEEFIGLRDYRPGDPLKHIHWKSWARTGKPVVKEFEDEFIVRYALVLDNLLTHPDDALFEEAVSVAASFTLSLDTQECMLDLLFVGTEAVCVSAGRGVHQAEYLLEILASIQPRFDASFDALAHQVESHVGLICGCILVLTSWDAARIAMVKRLQQYGIDLKIYLVTDLEKPVLDGVPAGIRIHHLTLGRIQEGLFAP